MGRIGLFIASGDFSVSMFILSQKALAATPTAEAEIVALKSVTKPESW